MRNSGDRRIQGILCGARDRVPWYRFRDRTAQPAHRRVEDRSAETSERRNFGSPTDSILFGIGARPGRGCVLSDAPVARDARTRIDRPHAGQLDSGRLHDLSGDERPALRCWQNPTASGHRRKASDYAAEATTTASPGGCDRGRETDPWAVDAAREAVPCGHG